MCINTGGEKVYPEEVEGAVKSHPAVFDAVVVGVPDERWGQRVAAVVQLRDGADAPDVDELADHCRTDARRLQAAPPASCSSTRSCAPPAASRTTPGPSASAEQGVS